MADTLPTDASNSTPTADARPVSPVEMMRQIDGQLSHVWMVRTFAPFCQANTDWVSAFSEIVTPASER